MDCPVEGTDHTKLSPELTPERIANPIPWAYDDSMKNYWGLLFMLWVLLFLGCATEAPRVEMVQPVKPPTGDDYRLVPASNFLTDYPDWRPAGSLDSWEQTPSGVRIHYLTGEIITIHFRTPLLFRILHEQDGPHPSYAVVGTPKPEVDISIQEQSDELRVKTPGLTLIIGKKYPSMRVEKASMVLAEFPSLLKKAQGSRRIRCDLKLEDPGSLFGFGEKSGTLARGGLQMKMWNSDTYRYTSETDPLYASIPFFLSATPEKTWGLFFDNTYQSYFDTGKTTPGLLTFGALGGNLDFWFFGADGLKPILADYTDLTGRISLPPAWALGYQQSRYSYTTAEDVLKIAQTFREKKLPAEVIYLDIDFMSQYRSFTHQARLFPDPKSLMDKLEDLHFKVVTIVDPGIARAEGYTVFDSGMAENVFVRNAAGALRTGTVWPGNCVFPDFTLAAARAWWGRQYQVLLDWGVDGIWNDMNEPSVFNTPNKTLPWDSIHHDFGLNSLHAKVHNVYGLEMLRASREGLEALRPGQRVFLLGRAGYAGVQRYAATWTGDNTANWDHLKMNLTMALGLGLSGQSYSGADVGGYSDTPSGELMARWMTLGALMPFYRNHTEKGTEPQEPWAFGTETEKVSRSALELRYTLLPLLQDLFYESYKTGTPILRPLFMEFPKDKASYGIEDQFMLGRDLLAAPVLTQGSVTRKVYLPGPDPWFDWWTGQEFRGGAVYEVSAPLDKIPLFARAGAMIPTREPEEWQGQKPENPVTVHIWPGASGSHLVWQDDGISDGYKEGIGRGLRLNFTPGQRDFTLTQQVEIRHPGFRPNIPYYLVRLHNVRRPQKVQVERETLPLYGDSYGVTASDRNTAWYENDNTLLVKIINWNLDQSLKIQY